MRSEYPTTTVVATGSPVYTTLQDPVTSTLQAQTQTLPAVTSSITSTVTTSSSYAVTTTYQTTSDILISATYLRTTTLISSASGSLVTQTLVYTGIGTITSTQSSLYTSFYLQTTTDIATLSSTDIRTIQGTSTLIVTGYSSGIETATGSAQYTLASFPETSTLPPEYTTLPALTSSITSTQTSTDRLPSTSTLVSTQQTTEQQTVFSTTILISSVSGQLVTRTFDSSASLTVTSTYSSLYTSGVLETSTQVFRESSTEIDQIGGTSTFVGSTYPTVTEVRTGSPVYSTAPVVTTTLPVLRTTLPAVTSSITSTQTATNRIPSTSVLVSTQETTNFRSIFTTITIVSSVSGQLITQTLVASWTPTITSTSSSLYTSGVLQTSTHVSNEPSTAILQIGGTSTFIASTYPTVTQVYTASPQYTTGFAETSTLPPRPVTLGAVISSITSTASTRLSLPSTSTLQSTREIFSTAFYSTTTVAISTASPRTQTATLVSTLINSVTETTSSQSVGSVVETATDMSSDVRTTTRIVQQTSTNIDIAYGTQTTVLNGSAVYTTAPAATSTLPVLSVTIPAITRNITSTASVTQSLPSTASLFSTQNLNVTTTLVDSLTVISSVSGKSHFDLRLLESAQAHGSKRAPTSHPHLEDASNTSTANH